MKNGNIVVFMGIIIYSLSGLVACWLACLGINVQSMAIYLSIVLSVHTHTHIYTHMVIVIAIAIHGLDICHGSNIL